MKEILGILIFFAIIIVGAVWLPGFWHARELRDAKQTSILDLKNVAFDAAEQAKEQAEQVAAEAEREAVKSNEAPVAPATDPAKLVVKVLNGGAPGGSAGKAAQILKTAGFKLTTAGDAKGDYVGVIVYYQSAGKADADAIKAALAKTYPNVKTQVETDAKKETASAAIVVVTGK